MGLAVNFDHSFLLIVFIESFHSRTVVIIAINADINTAYHLYILRCSLILRTKIQ